MPDFVLLKIEFYSVSEAVSVSQIRNFLNNVESDMFIANTADGIKIGGYSHTIFGNDDDDSASFSATSPKRKEPTGVKLSCNGILEFITLSHYTIRELHDAIIELFKPISTISIDDFDIHEIVSGDNKFSRSDKYIETVKKMNIMKQKWGNKNLTLGN